MDVLDGLDDGIELGQKLQEKEFTFNPGLVPLNHGSYGAAPRRVLEIQKRLMSEMNGHPDAWFRGKDFTYWTAAIDAAAEFLNCDPQDLVFVTNATEGVNTVLKSYRFQQGETILSTSITYGAVSLTCRDVAAHNTVIKSDVMDITYPIASEDDVIRQYEDYLKSHPRTRIAVIDYITSSTATVMPVKRLAHLCRKYGVLSLVDGAHAPGHVQIDLQDLDVDFLTGNFHKWLFTPRGCAVLYAKRKHHDWLKPLVTSWWTDLSLREQFAKSGTSDKIPLMCAKYGLEFLQRIGGLVRTTSYTAHLSSEAQQHLVNVLATEKLSLPKSMEAPNMKLVLLPRVNLEGSRKSLEDFMMGFHARTGIQIACVMVQGKPYLRISTAVYNYMEEYKRLGEALLKYIEHINNRDVEH